MFLQCARHMLKLRQPPPPLPAGDEILLNYRLSPHVPRPAWYYSIDPEAEARRWAQLPLARLLA